MPQQTRHSCGVWSSVPSPNVGTSTNFLNGVAAISIQNVWAVGAYGNGHGGLTLVEHWNGTQWNVVASPNVKGTLSDSLSGIVAITANNIWAVGGYNNASNNSQTLIEHWNGSGWSIVSSPDAGTNFNALEDISVLSSNDIWAVGYSGDTPAGVARSVTQHWDGSTWSIVPSPNAGTSTNYLYGVAAVSSNDVWAVGEYYIPSPGKWNTAWVRDMAYATGQSLNLLAHGYSLSIWLSNVGARPAEKVLAQAAVEGL